MQGDKKEGCKIVTKEKKRWKDRAIRLSYYHIIAA